MRKLLDVLGKKFAEGWQRMAGTEATYQYVVIAASVLGRVGVRGLGGGQFRIRVEPLRDSLVIENVSGWNTPTEDRPRYSKVVGVDGLEMALVLALASISVPAKVIVVNEAAPMPWKKIAQQARTARGLRAELRNHYGLKTSILLSKARLLEMFVEAWNDKGDDEGEEDEES